MRGFHPPNALRDSRRREFARALLLPRGCADGGECGGRGNAAALPGGRCAGQTGRLGHNDEQNKLAPARLGREQFGGGQIVFVAAGGMHTVALAEGGVLWAWGRGIRGQLGLGDRGSRLVPTRLGAGEVFGGSILMGGVLYSGSILCLRVAATRWWRRRRAWCGRLAKERTAD